MLKICSLFTKPNSCCSVLIAEPGSALLTACIRNPVITTQIKTLVFYILATYCLLHC